MSQFFIPGWPGLLVLSAVTLSGCSKAPDNRVQVFPAKGQVVFDGKPAAGAFVVFHPKGAPPGAPHPTAQVDKDGTFNLTTYDAKDGAPAGEYAVTVELRKIVGKGDDATVGPNVLPPKYSVPKSTTLQARVTEGPNDLPQLKLLR